MEKEALSRQRAHLTKDTAEAEAAQDGGSGEEAERVLERAEQHLDIARAAARATQVEVEPEVVMEALAQQVEHLRSRTARAKETERSERLRRRHQQLQNASVQWRQRNEFLPADELLLGFN